MPTSRWELVPEVVALVDQVPHRTVLDVGPGWGKYGLALRELLNVPPEQIDAAEAVPEYVDKHPLGCLYDSVWIGDVLNVPHGDLDVYDVVLMVDVIEHIADDAAFDLLDRIPGRLVISTPVAWFQTDDGLPEPERHVSHWTAASWLRVAEKRQIEVCYESLGAWLVRFGPL